MRRALLLAALAVSCSAPEPRPAPPPAVAQAEKKALDRAEPAQEGTLALSVESCLELALGGSHRIRMSSLGPKKRAEDFLIAGEVFAPAAWAELSGGTDRIPSTNVFSAADFQRESEAAARGGVGKRWETGLRTDLVWAFARRTTSSTFFTIDPRHEASLDLEVSHPLLQGFGAALNNAELRRAMNNHAIARAGFEIDLEEELLRAYIAYWALVLAAEDLSIQEVSLRLADEQVAISQDRLEAGAGAALEVTGAEAARARQREAVIEARKVYRKASDRLLLILRPSDRSEAYDLRLIPTTRPAPEEEAPGAPPIAEAAREALERRPELRRGRSEIANADLDLLLAEDALKMKADVFGSVGVAAVDPTAKDTLDELRETHFRDWTAGIRVEFLLEGESRRARRRRALLGRRESELRYGAVAAEIVVEVRQTRFEVEAARERQEATIQTLALAREQYEGETDRLRDGRSTPFQVELLRRDLLDAERNHLRAQIQVYVARALFDSSRGAFARPLVESAR